MLTNGDEEKGRASAEGGDCFAMLRLAEMHFFGEGGQRDVGLGNYWLTRAMATNDISALVEVGEFLEKRLGDCSKALATYERLVVLSPTKGNYMLGRLFLNRTGAKCPKDYERAYVYLSQSARNGHIPSKVELARLLRFGTRGWFGKFAVYPVIFIWYVVHMLWALSQRDVSIRYWRYRDVFGSRSKIARRLAALSPPSHSTASRQPPE